MRLHLPNEIQLFLMKEWNFNSFSLSNELRFWMIKICSRCRSCDFKESDNGLSRTTSYTKAFFFWIQSRKLICDAKFTKIHVLHNRSLNYLVFLSIWLANSSSILKLTMAIKLHFRSRYTLIGSRYTARNRVENVIAFRKFVNDKH